MKPICPKQRQAFIDCVLEYSQCIKDPSKKFSDCLGKDVFPPECENARKRLYECRKSAVDARSRLTKKLDEDDEADK